MSSMNGGCSRPEVMNEVPKDLLDRIDGLVKGSKRFLFMKGNKEMPRCRFSAHVVNLLQDYNKEFDTFDILADQEIRHAVKIYSNWPTFPQLYIDGKLIGGCDVITEMHEEGELESALG